MNYMFKDKNNTIPYCCCHNCRYRKYNIDGSINIKRNQFKCRNCIPIIIEDDTKMEIEICGITFIRKYDYYYNNFDPWIELLEYLMKKREFIKEEEFMI
jgi:hypothetical protein